MNLTGERQAERKARAHARPAWVIALLLSAIVWCPAAGANNPDKKGEVSAERAAFQQQKALAHMKELEERMFRLAELIRESQPEDSARLKLGVRKARDELLTERMRQVSQLINSMDLIDAKEQQQAIITDLQNLRTLLLTADLDTELKLEQLKKMREAIEKLDALIAEEQEQLNQTQPLTKADANPKQALMDALQEDEQRNARTAEDIKQLVEQLDGDAGKQAGRVGQAGKAMQGAAGKLGGGDPKGAAGKQKEALEALENARDRIAEARDKLKDDVEMTVRQKIMDMLNDMLAKQTQVREATEALSPRVAERQPQALLAVRRLAEAEDKIHEIMTEAIELSGETGFSVTLPPTLDAIRSQVIIVSDDLRTAMADEGVIAREKMIEDHLSRLIDAMELSNNNADPNDNPGNQPPDVNKKRQEMNKLLAEVRMLKIMQLAVNDATDRLEDDRNNKNLSAGRIRRMAGKLADQQEAVRETTRRLDEMAKKQQAQQPMEF